MWLKTRAEKLIEYLRSSYWFLTSVLALAGLVAGVLLVLIDVKLGNDWLGTFGWFYGSQPDGARTLLSTVAGSTITVAGVVFSVTLVAVTYASGQYGPRLLSNFTRDQGNQVSLGIFIGTFLYCLVVLRTVRDGKEGSGDADEIVRDAFVPHLAMFGALALAILSIGVLIYFVHHVTDSIHVNNVIARIGQSLLDDIARHTAENDDAAPRQCLPIGESTPVQSPTSGYVQAIDEDSLINAAEEHDVVINLCAIPGAFVHRGRPLMRVHGQAEDIADFTQSFTIGRKSTGHQDLRFAIDELVEIAARALSPGVNDPFTAIACIDWLGAALEDLAVLPKQSECVTDENGALRLVIPRLGFEDYLTCAVGQLRPYAAPDPNAGARLLAMLMLLADAVSAPHHRALIFAEIREIEEAADALIMLPQQLKRPDLAKSGA